MTLGGPMHQEIKNSLILTFLTFTFCVKVHVSSLSMFSSSLFQNSKDIPLLQKVKS